MLALYEICFEGMEGVGRFEVLALGEMFFEGMGAVEKGGFVFKSKSVETVLSYNTSISTRPSRVLLATRMG